MSGPTRMQVNGVELHYVIQGEGQPVVLVHGGGDDLRYWEAQVGPLSERYRVLTYSRRYVWPNRNPLTSSDHSALVDADDLGALLRVLGIERPHVIGHSYGAFTSLVLALRRPDFVRTLVLSEPPLLSCAREVPGGEGMVEDFQRRVVAPAAEAFRRKEPDRAMRLLLDALVKPEFLDEIPPEMRDAILGNARDFEAIFTSRDGFPAVSLDEVRRLRIPTLLFTGSNTTPVNTIGHRVLVANLPMQENLVIEGASHEVFVENPAATNAAVLAFLARN